MKFEKFIIINDLTEKIYIRAELQLIQCMRETCDKNKLTLRCYSIERGKLRSMMPPTVEFLDGTLVRQFCEGAIRLKWETDDEGCPNCKNEIVACTCMGDGED